MICILEILRHLNIKDKSANKVYKLNISKQTYEHIGGALYEAVTQCVLRDHISNDDDQSLW